MVYVLIGGALAIALAVALYFYLRRKFERDIES